MCNAYPFSACVLTSSLLATNCVGFDLVGNTVDYRAGGVQARVVVGSGARLRNNVFLEHGGRTTVNAWQRDI